MLAELGHALLGQLRDHGVDGVGTDLVIGQARLDAQAFEEGAGLEGGLRYPSGLVTTDRSSSMGSTTTSRSAILRTLRCCTPGLSK